MLRGFRLGALALLLALGTGAEAQDDGQFQRRLAAPAAPFVDVLSPHGDWLDVGAIGTVWRPSPQVVGSDFIPYATHGRWAYAPVGWVFVSNWSWGWATFHYGYWFFDPSLGWLWVPGTVWAPAWVHWRFGYGYVGWAAMPPPYFHFGGYYAYWQHHWCFTPVRNFTMTGVQHHLVGRHMHPGLYDMTQPVPRRADTHWPVGPSPTAMTGWDTKQVPTVEVRPPREGLVARVEPGPVVDRPVETVGAETWPRDPREAPAGKPNVRVTEPEEQAQAPERAEPGVETGVTPAPQLPPPATTHLEPSPRDERDTPVGRPNAWMRTEPEDGAEVPERTEPEEAPEPQPPPPATTHLEPAPREEQPPPTESAPREELGPRVNRPQPTEEPSAPRSGDSAPAPVVSAPVTTRPERAQPPPSQPAPAPAQPAPAQPAPAPAPAPAQPAPAPAQPAPAVATPAPAPPPPAARSSPPPSRPPPEAGAHASPNRGPRER